MMHYFHHRTPPRAAKLGTASATRPLSRPTSTWVGCLIQGYRASLAQPGGFKHPFAIQNIIETGLQGVMASDSPPHLCHAPPGLQCPRSAWRGQLHVATRRDAVGCGRRAHARVVQSTRPSVSAKGCTHNANEQKPCPPFPMPINPPVLGPVRLDPGLRSARHQLCSASVMEKRSARGKAALYPALLLSNG
ncbi:forkhead box protein B2 [Lates japonicus]|uniref:Forkhead box protein B2 n=1 Tax=Lates japonicus TaxID=270547 RepID=A0AAD3MHS3_LATJO|nr:forkhead box protein B2 [Lates japonicus]